MRRFFGGKERLRGDGLFDARLGKSCGCQTKGGGLGNLRLGCSIGMTCMRCLLLSVNWSVVHARDPLRQLNLKRTYLNLRMNSMVSTCPCMLSRAPFKPSLTSQYFIFKYLCTMAPFLQSKSSTSRILFIASRTSHQLRSKSHLRPNSNN